MSLGSPKNDLERRVAAQADGIYGAGWKEAIEAAVEAIRGCPSLDENGYVCQKSDAIKAIQALSS